MAPELQLDTVRQRIAAERDELVAAVGDLRTQLGRATDIGGRAQEHLWPLTGATFLAGFLAAGGLGAGIRLVAIRERRRRESKQRSWIANLLR